MCFQHRFETFQRQHKCVVHLHLHLFLASGGFSRRRNRNRWGVWDDVAILPSPGHYNIRRISRAIGCGRLCDIEAGVARRNVQIYPVCWHRYDVCKGRIWKTFWTCELSMDNCNLTSSCGSMFSLLSICSPVVYLGFPKGVGDFVSSH